MLEANVLCTHCTPKYPSTDFKHRLYNLDFKGATLRLAAIQTAMGLVCKKK